MFNRISSIVLCGFLMAASGCGQPTPLAQPATVPDGVTVETIEAQDTTQRQIIQEKVFDQCGSGSAIKAQVAFNDQSSQESGQALVLKGTVGGELGVSTAAKIKLEGEVEKHFTSSAGQTDGHTESISVEVPAHTKQAYTITWRESRRDGTITYRENGAAKTAQYSYRIGLELVSTISSDIPCPGGQGGAAQPTQDPGSQPGGASQPAAQPQATATPPPQTDANPPVTLPFSDNFDSGPRPEWRVVSGAPVVVDGFLTAMSGQQVVLEIGNNALQDYSVSFDYKDVHNNVWLYGVTITFGQRVRFEDVGCPVWKAYNSGAWSEIASCKANIPIPGNLRLVASGNHYQIFVNGSLFNEVTFGQGAAAGPLTLTINDVTLIDNLKISQP